MAQDNDLEAAIAALDAVCAQLDFVRGVRERHTAEVQLEVARHNLVRSAVSTYLTFVIPPNSTVFLLGLEFMSHSCFRAFLGWYGRHIDPSLQACPHACVTVAALLLPQTQKST